MTRLSIVIQIFKGNKIIYEIIFIIAINYEFTRYSEMDKYNMTHCSTTLRENLGSRLYQKTPSKMSLTLLKLKIWV